MSNVGLFTQGYVNPYVVFKGLEKTVKRPYGFDEKQGIFTSEQAKKDFKPGLIFPEKETSTPAQKTVKTLGIIGGLALAYIFRGKIKAGANKALGTAAPYLEKIWAATPAPVKEIVQKAGLQAGKVVKKVAQYVKPLIEKAQPQITKVLDKVKPFVEKLLDAAKKTVAKI